MQTGISRANQLSVLVVDDDQAISRLVRHNLEGASTQVVEAAKIIQTQPAALQLRYLQTLVEMAGERNSTIIPLTVDILNALSIRPNPAQR